VRGAAGAAERSDRREHEWFVDRQWTLKVGEMRYAGSRHTESFLFPAKYADRDTFVVQAPDWLL
jgi:hypothetical protein